MNELFFELYPRAITTWFIRLAIIPIFFLLVAWIIHVIWCKFDDKEIIAPIRRRIAMNKSLALTIVLTNIYWFLVVRYNGWDMFSWNAFNLDLRNVYLAITPLVATYSILIYWFYANNQRIKNQL
jgi:hypothetical protein